MKALIALLATAFLFASCGGDAEETKEKTVELKTYKDRLSYAMGADHAGQLMDPRDENKDKYDKEQIIKGFEIGLGDENSFGADCKATLEQLVGPSRQEFNAEYNAPGSLCIGKLLGTIFVSGWKKNNALDQFDLEMVKVGFRNALFGTDTLIEKSESTKMLQDFITGINKKKQTEATAQEGPFWEKVKAMKGIEALPEGLYLETVKAGTGGKPNPGDDVVVDYVVTDVRGDTIESSFEGKKMGQPTPAFSLNGVVRGWSLGIPFLKKGGKYRLFVPSELAYNEGPLVWYVELVNYGKPGTLAKPR